MKSFLPFRKTGQEGALAVFAIRQLRALFYLSYSIVTYCPHCLIIIITGEMFVKNYHIYNGCLPEVQNSERLLPIQKCRV